VRGYTKKGVRYQGFGIKTLNIIADTPLMLARINGVSESMALEIQQIYNKNLEYKSAIEYLKKHGLTQGQIRKIYKEYGDNAVQTVKSNPYVLSKTISGFGFRTCDGIAVKLGISPHSNSRLKQGIIYTLQEATTMGHCFLPESLLVRNAVDILSIKIPLKKASELVKSPYKTVELRIGNLVYNIETSYIKENIKTHMNQSSGIKGIIIDNVTEDEVRNALYSMQDTNEIVIESDKDIGKVVYTQSLYIAERKTASCILDIINSEVTKIDENLINRYIEDYEIEKGFRLEEKQREGVIQGFNTNLLCIAGEAGTGKSTVVDCIIYVMKKYYKEKVIRINYLKGEELNFMLTAPTGKASKRLNQVTGYEAKTIHRLLGYNPQKEIYKYNDENPLPYNLIIIDEFSMVDVLLASTLFKAIDYNKPTKIFLLGDIEQLPSVGAGNVLKDILESGVVRTVRLNVVKRQGKESEILANAHRVIKGEMIKGNNSDFFIIKEEYDIKVADKIVESARRLIMNHNYKIEDIHVLALQKPSEIGTEILNKKLQEVLNPPSIDKREIQYKNSDGITTFREGDKVINLTNNYNARHYYEVDGKYYARDTGTSGEDNIGVFNGEIGRIKGIREVFDEEINEMLEKVIVDFEGTIVLYDESSIGCLELGYATTNHKFQGSQAKVVFIPVHYRTMSMLNRNNLYTAITRGVEKVCVVGQLKAIQFMIKNIKITQRYTRLAKLLTELNKVNNLLVS
jgi:exodeoxyribonuclease V alpha subunit